MWSRLARFFVGLPIFQLVTPIFPCFFGGVLRAVFRSFLRFFIFSRVRTALPIYGFDFSIASYSFFVDVVVSRQYVDVDQSVPCVLQRERASGF